MNPEVTAEMRAAMSRARVKQSELARELTMHPSTLSLYLNNDRRMPEDFEERFWTALRALVEAEAARVRQEADDRSRLLLSAIPDPIEVAA